jgi:lactate permease
MQALLAAAPVIAVLVLMTARGWSATRAGLATAVLALVIAVAAFDFGGEGDPFGVPAGIAGVLAEAAFVAVTVVAIIGPALGIHHLQQRTGATYRLRAGLQRLHPDPRVAGLLIAWFFALFLEGAAGFGTPVALAAPFLVAAGFRPVAAVAAALVGHAVGVSFGAIGTPVIAQAALVDFTGAELARATVPYHLALGWILMGVVVVIIGRSSAVGSPPWGWGATAAVLFLVPYGLIGYFVGPELPTLGGALIGVAGFAGILALQRRNGAGDAGPEAVQLPVAVDLDPSGDPEDAGYASSRMSLPAAASPYLVLVALVLVTRLVPPVRDLLQAPVVEWEVAGRFTGIVRPLYHPALLLTVAFVAGALIQRATRERIWESFWVATRQLGAVVVALVAMVTIARTMSQAGMTSELAESAARAGPAWPLLAPAVGTLGTFITGSATASNVLFTDLQMTTAEVAGLPALPLLGAQGFGAAVGNVICPHNIVAAVATVGLNGREGMVLRRTLPTATVYVALGGVLALALAR